MHFKDYYDTLGVEPSASEAEIKTAYRRMARKYHPDVSKEAGAEEKFKAVNEAYEALRDPQKRAAYEQLRSRGYRPGDEVRAPPGGFDFNSGAGAGGVDFEEVFAGGGAGGGFSDFFETLFGRGRGGPSDPFAQAQAQQRARAGAGGRTPRNADTRAKLSVPLETVFAGDSVRVSVHGKTLDVRIPKGIAQGQVIRLSGQGGNGGALLLEIEYAAHPRFEVEGRTVIHVLPIAPWEAVMGATISVPTLGGKVELKIPPRSETGQKLRLRGRGLPGTPAAGDQIVELEVLAPVPETPEQEAAYAAMRDAFGAEWRRE